ncbi:hypothetical protein CCY99_07250 [Helicobacter sp. 16-1353]|uniref:hypothetical protein n=1 Tax=Helicobacter sp. 16-1353 TaxID=2004996 RepID=UPI000DCF0BA1|nr:hypothetical protein [Helicobacter sp. 16-1353]RAX52438.1 hypothetical protein CCY99_07250 [Helicobacter sp. 16-1353]
MSDYFEARGVSSETYENFILPSYFDFVLKDLESGARILDFGCGFGQVLGAIKRKYGGGG